MKATIRAAGRLALAATLLLLSWTGPLFALNNGAPVAYLYCYSGTAPASPLSWSPCSSLNPLNITGSFSATISGFPGSTQTTGMPIAVTTGGVTGTLPAGATVVATNVGTTNGVYCKLGASASTSDQFIGPNGGQFPFTVGTNTQLTCITAASTTTVNMVGGAGISTGSNGGGGGGGGGAVTQGTTPWTDQGAGASGAALAGNPFRVGLSDGTNNQNWLAAIALADGVNGNNTGAMAPWYWNGTTYDRATGTAALGAYVQAKSGAFASGSHASGSFASGAFASGSIGSGALASGSVASGAVASGAVASGAFASGSISSGAMVDIGSQADAVCGTATGTCSSIALQKYLNNAAGLPLPVIAGTLPSTQAAVATGATTKAQSDLNGNLYISPQQAGGVPLGQALGSASVPVVLPAAQITTLTPPSNTGYALSANQTGDPCSLAALKTNLPITSNTSALTQIIAASGSTKIYVCSLALIATSAEFITFNTGTGTNCGSSTVGLIGGTTVATNGLSLAANGGLTLGNGAGTIAVTGAGGEVCVALSGTTYINGNLTYVQQ